MDREDSTMMRSPQGVGFRAADATCTPRIRRRTVPARPTGAATTGLLD